MLIVIHVSKQQTLSADPKSIKQINFIGNLYRAGNTTMSSILGEAKTMLDFS